MKSIDVCISTWWCVLWLFVIRYLSF